MRRLLLSAVAGIGVPAAGWLGFSLGPIVMEWACRSPSHSALLVFGGTGLAAAVIAFVSGREAGR